MNAKIAPARRRSAAVIIAVSAAAMVLAGCSAADLFAGNEFFSESSMGVNASPRVTTSRNVPKGGGRYQLGQPYTVAGNTFVPREQPNLDVTGQASWYGPAFHGRLTANGEVFDQYHLSGAHPTLPLPSYVRVTNVANGNSTLVRINDRGPFSNSRVIDLSRATADVLGFRQQGVANVRVQYVGPAPLDVDDTRFLVASINQLTPYERDNRVRSAYQDVQVTEAAVAAANVVAGAPQSLPFELLSYGGTVGAATDVEPSGTPARITLGTFADSGQAQALASQFAVLGAVDTTTIAHGQQVVTELSLGHLREGVTASDVDGLATSLGLTPQFLY